MFFVAIFLQTPVYRHSDTFMLRIPTACAAMAQPQTKKHLLLGMGKSSIRYLTCSFPGCIRRYEDQNIRPIYILARYNV